MFNALGDYIKSVNSQSLIANMTLAYLTKIRLLSIEVKKYIKESKIGQEFNLHGSNTPT